MAVDLNTREGRLKALEGLWLIGIEPGQLQVDAALDRAAFLRQLNANGVNDTFITRAMAGVDWRASDHGGADLRTRVENWLKTAGYRPDEIEAFRRRVTSAGRSNDSQFIHQALTEQFNERTAGAVVHKATGGVAVKGSLWNPFRTDNAPKDVRLDFGTQGALIIPGGQDPNAPRARTVVSQQTQLPEPPRPGQVQPTRDQLPETPPAGDIPITDTGTPGGGGPGTPGTKPVIEKLTPQQRLERLQASYGWGAAFADIPEVHNILNRLGNDEISVDEADRLFKATDWYKTTTKNMREWHAFQKTDPEDAKRRKAANLDNIRNLARAAGIQNPDERRLNQINDMALGLGWSDTDVRKALAAEVRYDPSGAMTGTMAELKNMTRQWLVPLSNEAMTAWGQQIVAGTKTMDDFREYNRMQAKSMFPGLGTALDDPEMTVRTYLDPYAQDTANLLGVNPDDIDWMDPKYMRAFNQIDPKTNQRTIMNRADWTHTLMNDPTYGFDKSVKGQEARQTLTEGLMTTFGFTDF